MQLKDSILCRINLKLVLIGGLLGCVRPVLAPKKLSHKKAYLGANLVLDVEMAVTPQQQAQGLGGRSSLPEKAGMLFLFNPPLRPCSFWGKNTLIPLDIVFVAANQQIIKLADIEPHNVQKPVICQQPVSYAIEMNRGLITKYKLKIGDKLLLK